VFLILGELMRNLKTWLLTTTFVTSLAFISPAPSLAQQVSTLPLSVQLNLRTAATQGTNQLTASVYNAVKQYPSAAQSIVNEAARYRPGMGQSLADTANRALSEARNAVRAVETRTAARTAAQTTGSKATIYSAGPMTSGALSTGGWITLGLGVGAVGAVAATGVGGGSGDDTPTAAELEFLNNYGLGMINADNAYARLATGSGVVVAVADTGIDTDHAELIGQYSGGYNAFTAATGSSAAEDDAASSHGTFVSGIIAGLKNNVGIHGVAYDSTILPIKIFDSVSASATPAQTALAVNYAVSNGADIWNGSYGYVGVPSISAIQTELDAYANAMDSGMIMVFSAGNSSFAEPDLPAGMPYVKPSNDSLGIYTSNTSARDYSAYADRMLAVASVDENGTLSSFSNRCGIAAAWCLAAPGGSIYSTTNDGTYGTKSGTSFSAPHVAGAAALLIEKYPSLTSAQVVSRLLTTATKTGIYSNTTVYGQGLLNMTSATAFIASAMLPTGGSLRGPAYTLEASQFQLGSAFGDGLAKSLSATIFKPVDSFDGAAIETSAAQLVEVQPTSNSLVDGIRRFGRKSQTLTLDDTSDTQVAWQQVPGNDKYDAHTEATVTKNFSGGTAVTVGYMTDPAMGMGLMASDTLQRGETRAEGALFSPYLGFAQDGMNLMAQTKVAGITVRAASFTGADEDDEANKASGAAAELVFTPYAGAQVGLQTGFVREESSFLGSDSAGALAFGQTSTSYAGVSAKLPVTGNLDIVGSYFLGTSTLDPASGSLVTGFDNVSSDAFTIGAIRHNLATTGDRFGLMLNQPLRVRGGNASLSLPSGVDSALNVSYTNVNAGLTPTGREVNVEAFYSAPLSTQSQLNASVLLRHQPDHIATADDELQTLVRWQKKY
jgi:subtilisin family serine protease